MPKVEIIKPEAKVEINTKISQQDVIELIAHKQIKKLETQSNEYTIDLKKVQEKLKDIEAKYKESVTKEVTKLLNPFLSILNNEYTITISSNYSKTVLVDVTHERGYSNQFTIDVEKLSTTKTKTHLELEAKINELNTKLDDIAKEIDKIRNDKNFL